MSETKKIVARLKKIRKQTGAPIMSWAEMQNRNWRQDKYDKMTAVEQILLEDILENN